MVTPKMKGLSPFEPEKFYHVINHVIGKETSFRSRENYLFFLRKYTYYTPGVCDTYAYCLMPNHFHFLIKTLPEELLVNHPKFKEDFHKLIMQSISNLLNSYAKAFNRKFNRKGGLWMNFTRRFPINADDQLTSTINYIHQNPVHHGFVQRADGWEFSSFNTLFSEKPTLLKRQEILEWFGGIDEYLEYHKLQNTGLDDTLEI